MSTVRARWLGVLGAWVALYTAAAILLPPIHPGTLQLRKMACAGNLRQLYQLGMAYAAAHQGRWPEATGSALWLGFTRTAPPLVPSEDLEVLFCPVKGEPRIGPCDFLGPAKALSELKSSDALAADRPGNHGDDRTGNILFRDGTVREFEFTHPVWKTLAD